MNGLLRWSRALLAIWGWISYVCFWAGEEERYLASRKIGPKKFSPPIYPQELFMAHSQKYARETVLSRRIRDWEDMMGPQLEEQVRGSGEGGMGNRAHAGGPSNTQFSPCLGSTSSLRYPQLWGPPGVELGPCRRVALLCQPGGRPAGL